MSSNEHLVSVEDFHNYLPVQRGGIKLFSNNQSCLKLDSFILPPSLDETPAPGLDAHGFGVVFNVPSRLKVYQGKINEEKIFSGYYNKNSVVMVPRGQTFSYQWKALESSDSFAGYGVYLPRQVLDNIAVQHLSIDPLFIDLKPGMNQQCSVVIEITRQLIQLYREPSPLNQLYLESLTQFFAAHVLKMWCTFSHEIKLYTSRLSSVQIAKVNEYIEQHLDQKIGLTELAALVGLSEYHFIRQYKASTGYTPYQYLVWRRVEQAKGLLSHPTLPITDIALRLGFSDGSHFARVFRKLTGLSPRKYRRNYAI